MTRAQAAVAAKPVGFGSQSMRFETRGVGHPRAKANGTCIAMLYTVKPTEPVDPSTMLAHSPVVPQTALVKFRARQPATKAVKLLQRARTAELRSRGPGTYDLSGVAFDSRRIHTHIARPTERFKAAKTGSGSTPGPGHYRPETAPEKSSHGRGVMDGVGRDSLTTAGCGVAPGQYNLGSTMQKASAGKKGPYACYSGPRLGVLRATASGALGPTSYTTPAPPRAPGTLDFGKATVRFSSLSAAAGPDSCGVFHSTPSPRPNPPSAPFGTASSRDVYAFRMSGKAGEGPIARPTHDVCPNQYSLTEPLSKSKDWQGSTQLLHSHSSGLKSTTKRFVSPGLEAVRAERLKGTASLKGAVPSLRLAAPQETGRLPKHVAW